MELAAFMDDGLIAFFHLPEKQPDLAVSSNHAQHSEARIYVIANLAPDLPVGGTFSRTPLYGKYSRVFENDF